MVEKVLKKRHNSRWLRLTYLYTSLTQGVASYYGGPALRVLLSMGRGIIDKSLLKWAAFLILRHGKYFSARQSYMGRAPSYGPL